MKLTAEENLIVASWVKLIQESVCNGIEVDLEEVTSERPDLKEALDSRLKESGGETVLQGTDWTMSEDLDDMCESIIEPNVESSKTSQPASGLVEDERCSSAEMGQTVIPDGEANLDQTVLFDPAVEQTVLSDSPFDQSCVGVGEDHSFPESTLDISLPEGYTFVRQLGQGGMGVVYEVFQQDLSRRLALKMIRSDQLSTVPEESRRQLLTRFQREAEALGRLNHPSIVDVYSIGEHQGYPYYTMTLIQGTSLDALLEAGQSLDGKSAAKYLIPAGEALQTAHNENILHRDIKPQNILYDKDSDKVYVCDFGLVKILEHNEELTAHGILGSPAFMSPEQARDATMVTHSTDIYGMGASLYYLVTGIPPFQSTSRLTLLKKVLEEEPISPRRLNPELHPDVEAVCLKCLEKKPEHRYESMQEFVEDLQRIEKGEPTIARPVKGIERVWRWCKNHPATVMKLAASMMTLLILTAVIASLLSDRKNAEEIAQSAKLNKKVQEYYSTKERILRRRLETQPGWTWKNLLDIEFASSMFHEIKSEFELRDILKDLQVLRSETIQTLTAKDWHLRKAWKPSTIASDLVFTSDGSSQLFVTDFKSWLACTIRCHSLEDGKLLYTLKTEPDYAWIKKHVKQDGINHLALSPDHRWLVAGSRSGHVHFYDLKTRKLHSRLYLGHENCTEVEFSTDSQYLFAATANDTLNAFHWNENHSEWKKASEIADVGNMFTIRNDSPWTLREPGPIRLVTDEAHYINLVPDKDLEIVASLKWGSGHLKTNPTSEITGLVRLHSGLSRTLELMSSGRGRTILQFDVPGRESPFESLIEEMDHSDSARMFAATDDFDLKVWDTMSGQYLGTLTSDGYGKVRPRFSPDGTILASVMGYEVKLFDLRQSNLMEDFGPDLSKLRAMALSPDERYLFSLSTQKNLGGQVQLTIWDTSTKQKIWTQLVSCRTISDRGGSIVFTSHGDLLFANSSDRRGVEVFQSRLNITDNSIVIDRKTWIRFANFLEQMGKFQLDSDGKTIWWIQGSKQLWNRENFNSDQHPPTLVYDNSALGKATGGSTITDYRVFANLILMSTIDGRLLYFDRSSKQVGVYVLTQGSSRCLGCNPAGTLVAVGFNDGRIVVVDVQSRKVIKTFAAHQQGVSDLVFLNDHELYSAGDDGEILFWDLASQSESDPLRIYTLFENDLPISQLLLTRNGKYLYGIVRGEIGIRRWNLKEIRNVLREKNLDWE